MERETVLLIRWIPQQSSLDYASVGHEPGWLLAADGGRHALSATGLFLGADEEATWTAERLEAGPGDRLLLMTDGVSETFNPRDELFGRERVRRLLAESKDAPPDELVTRIDEALACHRAGKLPADDLTILAAGFTGPTGNEFPTNVPNSCSTQNVPLER